MADSSNSNLFDNSTGILPKDACVVIVRTEWNAAILDKLEEGARKVLEQHDIAKIKLTPVIDELLLHRSDIVPGNQIKFIFVGSHI